jgi:hypothetical protein
MTVSAAWQQKALVAELSAERGMVVHLDGVDSVIGGTLRRRSGSRYLSGSGSVRSVLA